LASYIHDRHFGTGDEQPSYLRLRAKRQNQTGRSVMNRLRILALAAVALVSGAATSQAGPCTNQIADVDQQIRQLRATVPPGGAGEPSAPQTLGAQLHHQPTPGSVENAEHAANADGDAALQRARKADADGNAEGCEEALREAKRLYGID
jgi:hypothetical protein